MDNRKQDAKTSPPRARSHVRLVTGPLPDDIATRATEPALDEARRIEAPPDRPRSVASVRFAASVTDQRLADDIGRRLAFCKALEGQRIELSVRGGVVEMAGLVDSTTTRSEAERIAASVHGAVRIDNRLTVRK